MVMTPMRDIMTTVWGIQILNGDTNNSIAAYTAGRDIITTKAPGPTKAASHAHASTIIGLIHPIATRMMTASVIATSNATNLGIAAFAIQPIV